MAWLSFRLILFCENSKSFPRFGRLLTKSLEILRFGRLLTKSVEFLRFGRLLTKSLEIFTSDSLSIRILLRCVIIEHSQVLVLLAIEDDLSGAAVVAPLINMIFTMVMTFFIIILSCVWVDIISEDLQEVTVHEKCLNTELFPVHSFLYSDWARRFTP